MSVLQLKSKAANVCDYHSVDISEFAIPLEADPVRLEKDIKNFRKMFATKEEVSEVQAQDMVTLSCSSENPKFNKEHLILRVGLGMYSKELEAALVGMACGEEKNVVVGKDPVKVSIEKIVREILPELTDELAVKSGIAGVNTVEDIHTYCRYKQYDEILEEPADEAFSHLAGKVIDQTSFELDPEELRISKENMYRSMEGHRLLEGKTFYEVTEEEFSQAFRISKQEMRENWDRTGEYMLKAAVLGQQIHGLTEADYETYLEKNATAMKRPLEEIRKERSLTDYLIDTYNEYYMDTMEAYVFRKLKEVGEWKHRSNQGS